jgi:DNA recombination protein RmuC
VELVAAAAGGAVVVAVLAWWLGRRHGRRDLAGLQGELAEARGEAQARDRELAGLRVKRERQIDDLLEQVSRLESERRILQGQLASLKLERDEAGAALEAERAVARDKLGRLGEAARRLEGAFKVLAAEALHLGQQSQALDGLITPLQESLEKYDQQVRWMEQARAEFYITLRTHLEAVTGTQERLHLDTGTFVQGLIYDRLTKLAEYFEELRASLEPVTPDQRRTSS